MKRLALLLTIVLVSLVGTVGVSQGADPAVQSIAYQLQSIQAKLDALQPKQYFLTNKTFKGDEANDAACGPGYHFASIFEILDPTALQYAGDNPLAIQFPSGLPMDLGQGPPTYAAGGWVHTGFHTESAGLGNANCEAWTSNAGNTFGTSVSLSSLWLSSQTCDRIAPWWVPQVATCDGADTANTHLWCVSNYQTATKNIPRKQGGAGRPFLLLLIKQFTKRGGNTISYSGQRRKLIFVAGIKWKSG